MIWGNKSQRVKTFGTKPKHFVHMGDEGNLFLKLSSERQHGGVQSSACDLCEASGVCCAERHRSRDPVAQHKMCLEVTEVEITKVLSSVSP